MVIKSKDEKKKSYISVYVTKEEKELIQAYAKSIGLGSASFMRMVTFQSIPPQIQVGQMEDQIEV